MVSTGPSLTSDWFIHSLYKQTQHPIFNPHFTHLSVSLPTLTSPEAMLSLDQLVSQDHLRKGEIGVGLSDFAMVLR